MDKLSKPWRIARMNAPMLATVAKLLTFAPLFLVAVAWPGGAQSEFGAGLDSSPWHASAHSRIRLISASGLDFQGRSVSAAAIEMVLDSGWKTYWRSPGEGVAPSFDWGKSGNLDKAVVLWPAPMRFPVADGGSSAGYAGRVVLPVVIAPSQKDRPVRLALAINYAICREICIPVEAMLELEIGMFGTGEHRDTLRAALDRVPQPQAPGVYCPHSFIAAAEREVSGKPALVIKTAFDERASGLELFAEAADGRYLPPPVQQSTTSRGRSHYVVLFNDERQAAALDGQVLTLTTVSDQGSCESTWRVK